MTAADVWLFSYGTLQQEDVQFVTFGRLLEGRTDVLSGYATLLFEIRDAEVVKTSGKTHHLIARPSGRAEDEVPGVVLRITAPELARSLRLRRHLRGAGSAERTGDLRSSARSMRNFDGPGERRSSQNGKRELAGYTDWRISSIATFHASIVAADGSSLISSAGYR